MKIQLTADLNLNNISFATFAKPPPVSEITLLLTQIFQTSKTQNQCI